MQWERVGAWELVLKCRECGGVPIKVRTPEFCPLCGADSGGLKFVRNVWRFHDSEVKTDSPDMMVPAVARPVSRRSFAWTRKFPWFTWNWWTVVRWESKSDLAMGEIEKLIATTREQ